MKEEKEYICIVCPRSCTVRVGEAEGEPGGLKFRGHGCGRGVEYARTEHYNPKRLLTTTVRVIGSSLRRIPVVSDAEIEKPMLGRCFGYLHGLTVQTPIKGGDVIVSDIMNSGVNIIAAQDSF
jgi:CxxC motif-containing protein